MKKYICEPCGYEYDPSSSNYAQDVRNKALENTPFGEDEPSTKTDYK